MCRSAPAADSACAAADADWSDGLADPHGGGARRSEVHCERSVPSRRSPAFRHGLAAKGPENWCPAAGPKPPDSLGERAPGYATDVDEAGRQRYDDLLRSSLLPGGGGGRLLGYGGCPPRADGPLGAAVDGCPSQRGVEPPRRFPKDPFRVLQAHGLRDDYYSTLLDFAAADDLAVGLGSAVDLWSSKTRISSRLVQLRGADVVQSVKWSAAVCSSLAVGTLAGEVSLDPKPPPGLVL
ncbi:unnamed protein product [Prorocentrum cordatum]|uniref:Uncharacterized protein n=1 Tax=Prorocentrum cordatum TaxID=2364126 RepID=A0ABN9S0N0_9DINO|nr:unnamed protein product [Polarella glacialis]